MADIPRMADFWSIPLNWPLAFKPKSKRAMCLATAIYAAGKDQTTLIDYALDALWVRDRDLEDPFAFADLIATANTASFGDDAETKALSDLTANTLSVFSDGVFGVPSFRLDNEVYFGADRMEILAARLIELP